MSIRKLGIGGSVLILWVALLGVLALPALAAAPETPKAEPPLEVRASTAVLYGVLDPGKSGGPFELGAYEFVYRQNPTACEGAGEVRTPEGMSLGGGEEAVFQAIENLTANTQYSVCAVAYNEAKTEHTVSAPVTFTTALPPEVPVTEAAEKVTGTTVTLRGEVDPGSTAKNGYYFAYSTNGECTAGGASEPGTEVTATKRKVSTPVAGLEPLREYTACLVATNSAGEATVGNAVKFTTPVAPPAIESESVSNVKAGEARLEGVVNPNNQLTECHFQYGEAKASENTVPCEPEALNGFGGRGVAVTVSLAPNKTYKYRIVAKNGTGEVEEGKEEAFTTKLTPEAPEQEKATGITATTATLNGVLSPNGEGTPPETGTYEFLYKQSASACELTQEELEKGVTQLRAPEPAGNALGHKHEAESVEVTGLVAGAQYTYCLRTTNTAEETVLGPPETFTTQPVAPIVSEEFVTSVAASSATLNGRVNPGGTDTTYHFEYGPTISYGTSLTGDAGAGTSAVTVKAHPQDLAPDTLYHYRLVAGNDVTGEVAGPDHTFTTQPVGTTFALPDGRQWEMVSPPDKLGAEVSNARVASGGVFQAAENGDAITYITSAPITTAARSNPWEPQAISRRGPDSWSTEDITTPHNGASAREFEEAKPGSFPPRAAEIEEYPAFSPDLSLAYVQPEAHTPLVPGQPPTERKQELNVGGYNDGYVRNNLTGTYSITRLQASEWSVQQVALAHGAPSCDASTSPAKGVGVDAVSSDGCYVYFNSASILAPGASGSDPLYVSHFEGGGWTTTFISSLSGTGAPEWDGLFVELSPNGRYVAFMSDFSLTGYDNRDARSGEPDEEVYLYDAAGNHLACASCNPTGVRPAGQLDESKPGSFGGVSESLVDPDASWTGHWLAGMLPEWSLEGLQGFIYPPIYQPHYLSDEGRLFFDSPDMLVPQDVNGLENVYEYEPEGVGSCAGAAGCLSLISSGTSSKESAFVDASTNGDDAFFITNSGLAPQDFDGANDIYDAHVCSPGVPCTLSLVSSSPCETSDSCKAPPALQPSIYGAPASSTFSGAGNIATPVIAAKPKAKSKAKPKKCRSGFHRNKQGRCVKQKTKANAKKSSRRSK